MVTNYAVDDEWETLYLSISHAAVKRSKSQAIDSFEPFRGTVPFSGAPAFFV